ncbi:MAG: HAD family hydrolase [Bulleidia sp.]
MMNCRCAIFDMDGTILYTLQDISDGLNAALRKNGLPERSMEEIRRFVGNGIHREVEQTVPEGSSKAVIQQVFDDFNTWYAVHCYDHTKPYNGILPLLSELRKAGLKTAIVSNKADYAVQILDEKYFSGLIDCGVGEKQGIARKPAPDTVNAVLEMLDADRSEAVYIGDSEVDLETAANARMDCIAVTWGYRDEDFLIAHGARTLARTPEELQKILLNQLPYSSPERVR